jgi:radical SAM/Cys-rich protein
LLLKEPNDMSHGVLPIVDDRSAAAEGAGALLRSGPGHEPFLETLAASGLCPLRGLDIDVLQVNVGWLCNMTCAHCHVDAGPERREIMSRETAEACIDTLRKTAIPTLDLTGGAPEMNPNFRFLVDAARQLGRHVIDRCNLTILETPAYWDVAQFLADRGVEIVASLPCYLEENVDAQRGDRAFSRSIEVLRRLNTLGYAMPGTGLQLTLVYNPVGPTLPPPQDALEQDYRQALASRFGIQFTRLIAVTNMPIGRYLDHLIDAGRYDEYLAQLRAAYNPAAAEKVMCRTTLSVDWQGRLYDCDFNQMLDLPLRSGLPRNIRDFDPVALAHRLIVTGQHCYGCTAGAGSSCRGTTV